jgi:hypothetical protein
VGELSLCLCTEPFTDSRATSTIIIYFSAVLGLGGSGSTFKRLRNYTPKLSALVYCIRLCFLEATLPRCTHPRIGWGPRLSTGQLKRLNETRHVFMCYSCQAPMGELLSLRSYGRALSRTDGLSFRVNWNDNSKTVSWDSGSLRIADLQRMGQHVIESTKASLGSMID